MEMQSTLTALNSRAQANFVTLLKSSPGLNIFKSETKRLMTITHSNLLITRTGINCQMSTKFGYIVHFAVELLALACLKGSYLTLSLS